MSFLKVKNRAISSLASGISDSDLSLTVATGEGALFPSTYPFHITIEDEILECTNRSTDVLTVTREAEGTDAAAHTAGKAVKLQITAGVIENVQTELTNHNAAVLSSSVHNNNNLFSGYGAEIVEGLRATIKVPTLTAISDPLSILNVTDWYGASGAYRQSDADSSATKIEDDDANFPNSIRLTIVKWASNAAGDADTGIGVIHTVTSSTTLTIEKCSGDDFAASYYYWIKHSELIIPVTGLYSVTGGVLFLPAEVDKIFQAQIREFTGTASPTQLTSIAFASPIATYSQPANAWLVPLTAGQSIFLVAYHTGTEGTPTLYYTAPSHNPLSIFLLKQTA